MSLRRSLDWSTALRDVRAQTAALPVAADRNDRFTREFMAKSAVRTAAALPLITETGTYNKSSIMRQAIAEARLERARGSTLSWSALLSTALKFAWLRAKMARRAH